VKPNKYNSSGNSFVFDKLRFDTSVEVKEKIQNMATLIPHSNTSFTTQGESRFYDFLKEAAKPDSQCIAWYSPQVGGREPDFVLYTPEVGLVVFEVKDWITTQVAFADAKTFRLRFSENREEVRANPIFQGREYIFSILNKIRAAGRALLSSDPRYQGKPAIPVHCGVVFANMNQDEFLSAGLDAVIPADKILFEEEIHSTSALYNDRSGGKFRQKLLQMFPPPFPFSIQKSGLDELRRLLWPEVQIAAPTEPQRKRDEQAGIVRLLDSRQESLARRLDAPKAIIHGSAGSGKSILLAHKAIAEWKRLQGAESVLLVCFNMTLVHYLKRLLSQYGAPLGSKGIRVVHFYDFCRTLVKETIAFEKEEGEYYQLVCDAALEAAKDAPKIGAILVDEGQDFSDAMMEVLKAIAKPEALFWVAMDSGQNLYNLDTAWADHADFRHFTLHHPYRATQVLSAFCEKIMHAGESECNETVNTETADTSAQEGHTTPDIFAPDRPQGQGPIFMRMDNDNAYAGYITNTIKQLHAEGIPLAEIRVLYASKKAAGRNGGFPEFLADYLENEGILSTWVSKDAAGKSSWDCTTERVAISTIHSMKGLDATAVFVCGLDTLEKTSIPKQSLLTLAYVACTRAREMLHVVHEEETPVIAGLLR
jgi:Superfamily I DNA and RNA helicases